MIICLFVAYPENFMEWTRDFWFFMWTDPRNVFKPGHQCQGKKKEDICWRRMFCLHHVNSTTKI